MESHTDRRVRRTRNLLQRALTSLILEKEYDRITVQDILDRADIGRSTFYAHYRGKDELLLSGLDGFRAAVADALTSTLNADGARVPMLALFQHVDANRGIYRATVGSRAAELGLRAVRRLLTELITEHLQDQVAVVRDESRLATAVAFLVSGLIGLLTWWLDTEAALSAEEMYERFRRLSGGGLPALLVDGDAAVRAPRSAARLE